MYLYAVRDINTGKLVKDITNPGHKFWEKKGNCQKAIDDYNNGNYYYRRTPARNLELVTFELVEVNSDAEKQ
jgi:hypothetical protein